MYTEILGAQIVKQVMYCMGITRHVLPRVGCEVKIYGIVSFWYRPQNKGY
jgi:hypothetical protein